MDKNPSLLFSFSESLASRIAQYCFEKKWNLSRVSLFIVLLGVLSPFPLVLELYFPSVFCTGIGTTLTLRLYVNGFFSGKIRGHA